jgi:glutathione synthase/RimK-type ligase-like ATP-grasp enzyme
VDWASYPLAVIRSTWDYPTRVDEFLAWVQRASAAVELCNPRSVLEVNTDKHYLGGIAAHGLPVVPTWIFEPGSLATLPALEGDVVVKPAVGAGSRGVGRFSDLDAAERYVESLLASGRAALVQPFLADVDASGEIGLVYFDGVFSHAFGKTVTLAADAAPSDDVAGPSEIVPRSPTAYERAVADGVVEACAAGLLYARVDLITDGGGEARVVELEVTEPAFFFEESQASAEPYARAIARRLATIG